MERKPAASVLVAIATGLLKSTRKLSKRKSPEEIKVMIAATRPKTPDDVEKALEVVGSMSQDVSVRYLIRPREIRTALDALLLIEMTNLEAQMVVGMLEEALPTTYADEPDMCWMDQRILTLIATLKTEFNLDN